jgi:hypothetical protein
MLDVDTFLTILYVMVDDLYHYRRPKRRPAPEAALSESKLITLGSSSLVGDASPARGTSIVTPEPSCGALFPTLPDRSQFNRLVRSQMALIEEVALYLAAEARWATTKVFSRPSTA